MCGGCGLMITAVRGEVRWRGDGAVTYPLGGVRVARFLFIGWAYIPFLPTISLGKNGK